MANTNLHKILTNQLAGEVKHIEQLKYFIYYVMSVLKCSISFLSRSSNNSSIAKNICQ